MPTVMNSPEMKKTERDLMRLFDLSSDLFCIISREGYFLRVNGNFPQVLGYTQEEFLTRPFLEFVHLQDRRATREEWANAGAGLSMIQFRNRCLDNQGRAHWFEWTANSIPEEGVIFAVARDVTEKVSMEKELLAREERERSILDNTIAVVYVKGVDGRYQFVNQRYADLFSLDRAGVIGKTDRDVFSSEIADEFQKNDRRVAESGETTSIEEVVPHADGLRTYVSVRFPLFDGGGRISAVAGISTDITDHLRARQSDEQMRLARVFQQKLYPPSAPSVPGLDVAGSALPVTQMSGDYFDYVLRSPPARRALEGSRLAWAERRLVISLGDVTGHGFGPALQMVEVRAMLRLLLRGTRCLRDVVEDLNRLLCSDLPESSFVSLFLAEVDAGKQELRYVGAGHQALLFDSGGGVTTLESTGLLLGIDSSAAIAESDAIPVRSGDRLVVFTDGLTEAMNLAGEQFGAGRVVEAVNQRRRAPSRTIVEGLFAAVRDFTEGQPLQDDMTAVSMRFGL
jgi:PAS domain S-box-containing protein